MATDLNSLMEYVKKGDETAFEQLYLSTKKQLFFTLLAIVKDYRLAEDLMQDTYIKLRLNPEGYRANTNALGYILTVGRNLALNEYNRRKREVATDFTDKEYMLGDYTINGDVTTINYILKLLDVDEREIVILYTISGFKHNEIARITGKPLGTVLWMYSKAMKKLRKKLKEEE